MPNTLAHLGLQGLITRVCWKNADLKWIYLGCIIPDFSWIIQRAVYLLYPGADRYSLLLYVSIQASLCFCLILSAAVATLSLQFQRTFAILGISCFLHLILDACQFKWSSGVHFIAPFSWHLTNIGFFWPESLISYLATVFGLVYILVFWGLCVSSSLDITFRSPRRLLICFLLVIVYFGCPLFLLDGPRKADNYFVATLQDPEKRVGKFISLDRAEYFYNSAGGTVETFSGEILEVEGIEPEKSSVISINGYFITKDKLQIQAYHVHKSGLRDIASLTGLCLVALLWVNAVMKNRRKKKGMSDAGIIGA